MTRPQGSTPDKLNDADYPAYTIGLAADLLGVQPAFLRSLDAAGLLTPNRSAGGQRRYSRADLILATQVGELLDQNMPLAAATRIVSLEHQLADAHPAHRPPRTNHQPAQQRPEPALRTTTHQAPRALSWSRTTYRNCHGLHTFVRPATSTPQRQRFHTTSRYLSIRSSA